MRFFRVALDYLQQIMGEAAYARYCEHLRRTGRGNALPTPQQFYLDLLECRYSRPSRCC